MQLRAVTLRDQQLLLLKFSSVAEGGLIVLKVMKELGAAWKTLSLSEKEAYKGKAGQSS